MVSCDEVRIIDIIPLVFLQDQALRDVIDWELEAQKQK